MKFAIITDSHFGPSPWYFGENRIMSEHAAGVLKKIVAKLNAQADIAFVMQLGDLIQEDVQSPDAAQDTESFKAALAVLSDLRHPLYHVVGNHEPCTLGVPAVQRLLGYEKLYYAFETDGYHCIALFSDAPEHKDMTIASEQIAWLATELEQATKPVLVFIHHQLVPQSLDGHYWFAGRPDKAFVQNGSVVTELFEKSQKVQAVFNGHMHWNNFFTHNGIPYFTIESMVEDANMEGVPGENYAIIDVSATGVKVSLCGIRPAEYTVASRLLPGTGTGFSVSAA